MVESESLLLPDRCLVVYVDDTGHEALVPGHPVYGLGGCAVLGRDLNRLLWEPWRAIRQRVTGSPDTPLHANTFPTVAKGPDDMEAVATFFREQPFARFGAILSVNTTIDGDIGIVRLLKEVLENRINDVMQWTLCREVKVIFESSQRADRLIEEAFQTLNLHRGWKTIPAECYFMPKSVADPALEVADFVVHAVGRQARQNLKDPSRFGADFKAIFHDVDRKLVSFMDVQSVTISSPQNKTA